MSLRIFHVIFVMVCVALSVFVTAWAWKNQATALMVTFAVFAVALIVYGASAFKKLKELE
jgi:membrane protein implicated in regulation of membrane protease activity